MTVDHLAPANTSRPTPKILFNRINRTGVIGPIVVLAVILVITAIVQPSSMSLLSLMTTANTAAPVAIAAAGATIIILVGGIDLSVGAVLSLVNVVIATQIADTPGSQLAMIFVGLGVGAAVGLVNGLLITYLNIPSIVGTLAMSFLWGGVALLVLEQPGGSVPLTFVNWFTGLIGNVIPAATVLIIVVIVLWLVIKRTALGRSWYAIGGDIGAAKAAGIRTGPAIVLAYTLGGLLYGLAGVFLTAQSASGDPNVGTPLLLTVFAALVIGGAVIGGGKGDLVGSIVGAFIITLIANLLFALGVSSFYTPILNGVVLLIAVIAASVAGVKRFRSRRPLPSEAATEVGGDQ